MNGARRAEAGVESPAMRYRELGEWVARVVRRMAEEREREESRQVAVAREGS